MVVNKRLGMLDQDPSVRKNVITVILLVIFRVTVVLVIEKILHGHHSGQTIGTNRDVMEGYHLVITKRTLLSNHSIDNGLCLFKWQKQGRN